MEYVFENSARVYSSGVEGNGINSVSIDASGRYFVSGSSMGILDIYCFDDKIVGDELVSRRIGSRRWHNNILSSIEWSRVDSEMLVSGDSGGNISIWDANRLEVVREIKENKNVCCVDINNDNRMVSGVVGNECKIYDLRNNCVVSGEIGVRERLYGVVVDRSDDRYYTVGGRGGLYRYDIRYLSRVVKHRAVPAVVDLAADACGAVYTVSLDGWVRYTAGDRESVRVGERDAQRVPDGSFEFCGKQLAVCGDALMVGHHVSGVEVYFRGDKQNGSSDYFACRALSVAAGRVVAASAAGVLVW